MSRRWILFITLFGAAVVSIVTSSRTYVAMLDHGHDWWRIFLWHLGGWSFWVAAGPWVAATGSRLVRASSQGTFYQELWPVRLVVQGALLTATHVLSTATISFMLQAYEPVATYSFGTCISREAASWWKADPLIFGVLLAVGYGMAGVREARESALRESKLEAELSKAQLEALRLQIQPHFLMNTLNAIAALVRRQENTRALDMLIGLSELLHTTLDSSRGPVIPLRDEIAFVERYAALQQVRFADRLRVTFEVDPAAEAVPVPTLLLQPLVENAIRHGIAPRSGPGSIALRAVRENGTLHLSVIDDGRGLPAGFDLDQATGIGLGNIRSRLAQHFGDDASLRIRDREQGGTEVAVRIPVRPTDRGRVHETYDAPEATP